MEAIDTEKTQEVLVLENPLGLCPRPYPCACPEASAQGILKGGGGSSKGKRKTGKAMEKVD